MALELGLLGLLLWVALSIKVIVLVVRRLRRIDDVELRLSLAGIFAAIIAFTIMGFVGPTMSSLPFGPYFWFSIGIASYWFKMRPLQMSNQLVNSRSGGRSDDSSLVTQP